MAHNQNDVCSCFGNSDVSSCNSSHHRERSYQMHMKDLQPVDQKVVLNCVLPDLSTISDITSGIAFRNMRPFDENTIGLGRNRQKLPIEHFYKAPVVSSESENGEFSGVANYGDSESPRAKGDFHQFSGTVLPFRKSPASNSSESKKRISVCKSKCCSSKIDSKPIYSSHTSHCDTEACDNLIFENQQKCLDVSRRKSGAINSNNLPLKDKSHSNRTQTNEKTIKNTKQHKLSQKRSQVPYLKSNCSGDVPTYVKKYQATNHRVKIPDRVKLKVIEEQSPNNYPDELDVNSADENAGSEVFSETSSETEPFDALSDNVRGYIKKQDEKIIALQNQISALCDKLEQSNKENCIQNGVQSVNLKQRFNRTPLLENNFLNTNSVDGQFFLRYLQDCDGRMCKFQNQIDNLLQRMEELEMLHSVKDSSGFASGPISTSNDPCLKEFKSAHIQLADDECEAKNEEECGKKTISTSTMTSVTLEGNDRLVYREMIRVTDYSNCNKKDVSVQCVQNMNTNKIKNGPSRKKSSNCSDNCTPKYKNSVHNRSGGKKSTKSQQKDKYFIDRDSPILHPIYAMENNENVADDLNASSKSKNIQNPLPILESVEDGRLVANAKPLSANGKNILPSYQSIIRNIDELCLKSEDKVDFQTPPMQAHTVPQSHYKRTNSSRKKLTTCQNTSPKRIRQRYRSPSISSTSSNVSVESLHTSPQHSDVRESDELYANNPHFSQASQKYLIKYGLIPEKNSNMQKTFHRKSKSPECRHHLR